MTLVKLTGNKKPAYNNGYNSLLVESLKTKRIANFRQN